MKITLEIPDNKMDAFLALIKDLTYIKEKEIIRKDDSSFPTWQNDLAEERMEDYKKNPYPLTEANKFLDDLEKEE
jgi:hypothetical protein